MDFSRFSHALLSMALLIGSLVGSQSAHAALPADDPTIYSNGYRIDPGLLNFVQQHGGVQSLGLPISNVFTLLGKRVQLFERQAVEIKSDGSLDTLNLVDGNYFPLARLGGASLSPDPDLLAKLPALGGPDGYQRASAYLDATAPAEWNGMPVQFGAAFRSSVRCVCDDKTRFRLAADLWGLPVGRPTPDPRTSDYVYLWFQRGVLVYSRVARDSQWLLVGEIFKRVLQGADLPPDMLAHISASPGYARLYAQYDPLARDGLARPTELPNTSLGGAFVAQAAPTQQPPPQAAPAARVNPPAAPVVVALDPHFGVAEGFRAPEVMADVKAGWERVVIPWDQVQPDGPADFSHLGLTLSADRLRSEVARGVHVAAVLQFTPSWAQSTPAAGQRSVPRNLDLPFDDPANYWGRFVYETVKHYAGRIDEWIIWNEPEFRPNDSGAGGAYNWAGNDEEFAQLLRVAYQAAHKANPAAVVSFPATSYWVEELSQPRRTPFYERILNTLNRDARSAEHSFYHDAVALNLYRSPDDIYRIHAIFGALQRVYGLDKPIWLTEMNAMATDDAQSQCAARDKTASITTSLEEQAAYVVQSYALAAAAGYQRTEFYKMMDGDSCREPAWGMVRANGTRRSVVDAARMAITYFSNYTSARFAPLVRGHETWPAWPSSPGSYVPNWQVYLVAFDRPGNQRVTAVWNGDGVAQRVRIPSTGSSARLINRKDGERQLRADASGWVVDLPPATAHFWLNDQNKDPDGYHVIGGDVQLIVEEGVDPGTPVAPPRLDGN